MTTSARTGRHQLGRRAITVLLVVCGALSACGLTEGGSPDPLATAVPLTTVVPGPALADPTPDLPTPLVASPSSGAVAPTAPATTTTPTAASEPVAPAAPTPVLLGEFPVEEAPEASGLAASAADPDLLWILDDGPGTTSVLAVATDGTVRGRVTMEGVESRDTEALAVAPCQPGGPSCLWVGDIGDNVDGRASILVHRFPEPDPTGDPTVVVETAAFTYPAGPVNAEAMIIDLAGRPVVLTREEGITRLFRATTFTDGPLEPLAQLTLSQPARPLLTMFAGLLVTDAALSADGAQLLLRNYDTAVLLTAPSSGADLASVATWDAQEVPTTLEPQGEAIAWTTPAGRGRGYATASEGTGQLWFTPLP